MPEALNIGLPPNEEFLKKIRSSSFDQVKALLADNPALIHAKGYMGKTVLHVASQTGRDMIIQYFIQEKGLEPNILDDMDRTPLYNALGDVKNAKILIKNGANVNVEDRDGYTPLFVALQYLDQPIEEHLRMGKENIASVLIKAGADLNIQYKNDETLLHYVLKSSILRPIIAKMLIEAGANIDVKDAEGQTPLHIAAKKGYIGIVEQLIERKANPNVKDKEGKTPLELAQEHLTANDEIIIALQKVTQNNTPLNSLHASQGELKRGSANHSL